MSASFLGALCLFSSVCVVCAISAFTLPIETKGRALQVCDSGSSSIFLQLSPKNDFKLCVCICENPLELELQVFMRCSI